MLLAVQLEQLRGHVVLLRHQLQPSRQALRDLRLPTRHLRLRLLP
jgi:hypothetical protein